MMHTPAHKQTTPTLPPLPEPKRKVHMGAGKFQLFFAAEQMRAYALAAIEQASPSDIPVAKLRGVPVADVGFTEAEARAGELAFEANDGIAAALTDPACKRLAEWVAIGPVQRAAVESFADRIAQPASAGWRLVPESVAQDAAMLQFLEDQTMQGHAPNLVFDDDGNWCVSYTGMQPMPRGDGQGFDETVTIACVVHPTEWRPSLRAAIQAAMDDAAADAALDAAAPAAPKPTEPNPP